MRRTLCAAAILLATTAPGAAAVETIITVRAISRDAKVMGTKVGGARITIREAKSGKLLVKGIQMGGTGDTKSIILEPHTRGSQIYSAGESGSFEARLDIDEPTWIEITAEGALGYPQSSAKASKALLVIPGEHVYGEGVLLELHGFNVELLAPTEDAKAGEPITVRTKLTMT
jgi:hypothetical protein